MYATDFLFDGQRASDFGCMICSFDENAGAVSGGEIEYNTAKSPGSDRSSFYGAQFNSPVTWNFSICKDPDMGISPYFSQYEEGRILKWLVKTDGYRFIQFDQEGYEDIFYYVYFNVQPHQVLGQTVGFDLTMTSDCAYGFSDVITRKTHINSYDSSDSSSSSGSLMLDIHSDVKAYILPTVKINGYGKLSIVNYSTPANTISPRTEKSQIGKPLSIIVGGEDGIPGVIQMDSATEIVTGLNSPGDFDWNFLKLADGKNFIEIEIESNTDSTSNANINIEIQYREPRYVRI